MTHTLPTITTRPRILALLAFGLCMIAASLAPSNAHAASGWIQASDGIWAQTQYNNCQNTAYGPSCSARQDRSSGGGWSRFGSYNMISMKFYWGGHISYLPVSVGYATLAGSGPSYATYIFERTCKNTYYGRACSAEQRDGTWSRPGTFYYANRTFFQIYNF